MDTWVQVFRTGNQTDSFGNERFYGKDDLDAIVNSYDPLHHEAPVVIGHPEENAPAYGWVESLKRDGETLLAKFRDLVPEFWDLVKRGLYKKRSIALYPDLSLRHIGFLGAVPPAVKGLENIQFHEGNRLAFNFSEFEENEYSSKGGIEMGKPIENDPGKELERRIKEVMRNSRSYFDRYGNRFSEDITYRQAFIYVQEEDPELAQQFAETLRPQVSPEKKKSLAAGEKIMSLVKGKMKADKKLTYSEALNQVQKENRPLILEYLGK